MTQHFFIGVDGGATKSLIRIEDEAGNILSQALNGPANIRISVAQAWQSINTAWESALHSAGLTSSKNAVFHAGMGLAGCEMDEAYQAFLNQPHPFATLIVSSDAYTACLGAHGGEDGAIIVAGTGVVGLQIQSGQMTKVGGHGFPHDDEGGGAWLGLEAIKMTLQWLDGRLPASGLAKAVYTHFSSDSDYMVNWANAAHSTAFATLAPLVMEEAKKGDRNAIALLKRAALALDQIGYALERAQTANSHALPCAMVGGVAPFLEPHLGFSLRSRLCSGLLSPDAGAVLLVRHYLQRYKGNHD